MSPGNITQWKNMMGIRSKGPKVKKGMTVMMMGGLGMAAMMEQEDNRSVLNIRMNV